MGYQPLPTTLLPVTDPKPGLTVWVRDSGLQGTLVAPKRFGMWVVRLPSFGAIRDISYSIEKLGIAAPSTSTPPEQD